MDAHDVLRLMQVVFAMVLGYALGRLHELEESFKRLRNLNEAYRRLVDARNAEIAEREGRAP